MASEDTLRGVQHDGTVYCYGGCGTRYEHFPCDLILPTPLWNRIAVGEPFDMTYAASEREGRGGVLCPSCIVQRLAALPDCTVVFADLKAPVGDAVKHLFVAGFDAAAYKYDVRHLTEDQIALLREAEWDAYTVKGAAVTHDHVSVWRPEPSPRKTAVMGKLTEECGELIAILGRCIAQGVDQMDPDTGKPNRQALHEELADVEALIQCAIHYLGLSRGEVVLRSERKAVLKARWLEQVEP